MKVSREYSFYDLYNNSWSGAINTLKVVIDNNKEDEWMNHLEEIFEGVVDATELNDYLWFNDYDIFNELGIEY